MFGKYVISAHLERNSAKLQMKALAATFGNSFLHTTGLFEGGPHRGSQISDGISDLQQVKQQVMKSVRMKAPIGISENETSEVPKRMSTHRQNQIPLWNGALSLTTPPSPPATPLSGEGQIVEYLLPYPIHLMDPSPWLALQVRLNGMELSIEKSCSVIPAPGDPYSTDYQSPATAFDVWWKIFHGVRGTYGFRTEMWIDDDISESFAFNLGLGAANLPSWFHATDNCKWDHSSGMEYGSAVLVSGYEGDRAYDSAPLPPPSSLTIWWQHP